MGTAACARVKICASLPQALRAGAILQDTYGLSGHADVVDPASAPTHMASRNHDETYAALLELVLRELGRLGYLPGDVVWPDLGHGHRAPAGAKVRALVHAYRQGGPAVLLAVGQGVAQGRDDPFVQALLGRRSPVALAQTWARLEAYGHSENRTRFVAFEPTALRVLRHRLDGGYPTFVEGLLIVGILGALLAAIGAREVAFSACLAEDSSSFWSPGRPAPDPLEERPLLWTIRWTSFTPTSLVERPLPSELVDGLLLRDPSGTLGRLLTLLGEDAGRSWRLDEAARVLGLSTRTLQRRLQAAHVSFASVVRRVRVGAAVTLLRQRRWSLALIACSCGFADGPHLSREVRRVVGASPRDLRALLSP